MARFVQMLERSGVYADQNFMVVPQGGFNLVYLREGKGYRIDHDRRLKVHEVRFNEVERIANDYVQKRNFGINSADQLLRLRTAMYGSAASTANGNLLQVSAIGAGIPTIMARHGTSTVRLDVGILRRKEFSVSFKLVKQQNGRGAMVSLTKFHTAEARDGSIN